MNQKELEALSDDGINEAMCKLYYPDCSFKTVNLSDVTSRRMQIINGIPFEINNYCNDVLESWPIILENKISVYWKGGVDDDWKARTIHTPFINHKNPLRAAMIVFLLMKNATK